MSEQRTGKIGGEKKNGKPEKGENNNGRVRKNWKISCVDCGKNGCRKQNGDYPEFCEIPALTEEEIEKLRELYQDEENRRVAIASAEVEGEFYGTYTRVEETIEFAQAESEQRNSEL